MALRPCPSCARHVRHHETACPFCASALDVIEERPARDLGRPTSRAAIAFFGAAATIAACGGGVENQPTSSSSSGGSSSGQASSSSGGSSGGSSGTAVLYGPAVVDSGTDAEPEPQPMYGPAIIDAGED